MLNETNSDLLLNLKLLQTRSKIYEERVAAGNSRE